jgi:hypothetical protein
MLRRETNQCKVNYFGGTGMQNVFSFASRRFFVGLKSDCYRIGELFDQRDII